MVLCPPASRRLLLGQLPQPALKVVEAALDVPQLGADRRVTRSPCNATGSLGDQWISGVLCPPGGPPECSSATGSCSP
jgi:hypothetical protein